MSVPNVLQRHPSSARTAPPVRLDITAKATTTAPQTRPVVYTSTMTAMTPCVFCVSKDTTVWTVYAMHVVQTVSVKPAPVNLQTVVVCQGFMLLLIKAVKCVRETFIVRVELVKP
jgi:hypothetical protein